MKQNMKQLVVNDPYQLNFARAGKEYARYRELWALAGQKKYSGRVPLHLDFDTVDACNLRCSICHERGRVRTGTKMPLQMAMEAISQGAGRGLYSVNIGGVGEPYLQKQALYELASFSVKKGMLDIFVHTNFLLLKDDDIHATMECGITCLCISVDAITPETYKKIRGGDFEAVMENVRRLNEYKKRRSLHFPLVRVSAVPCDENNYELPRFFDYWAPYADVVEIQSYRYDKSHENKRMVATHPVTTCSSPWMRLMYWPNGDVTACCCKDGLGRDIILGNVLTEKKALDDYWNGPTLSGIREAISDNNWDAIPSCKSCLSRTFSY